MAGSTGAQGPVGITGQGMTGTCALHTLYSYGPSSLWTRYQVVLHPPCMQEQRDLKVALLLPVTSPRAATSTSLGCLNRSHYVMHGKHCMSTMVLQHALSGQTMRHMCAGTMGASGGPGSPVLQVCSCCLPTHARVTRQIDAGFIDSCECKGNRSLT